jgi:hypothetical protein
VFGVLSPHESSPVDAFDAYGLVIDYAHRAALAEIRMVGSRGFRSEALPHFSGHLGERPSDDSPHWRQVDSSMSTAKFDFDDRVFTLFIGMGVPRVEPREPVLDLTYASSRPTSFETWLHT